MMKKVIASFCVTGLLASFNLNAQVLTKQSQHVMSDAHTYEVLSANKQRFFNKISPILDATLPLVVYMYSSSAMIHNQVIKQSKKALNDAQRNQLRECLNNDIRSMVQQAFDDNVLKIINTLSDEDVDRYYEFLQSDVGLYLRKSLEHEAKLNMDRYTSDKAYKKRYDSSYQKNAELDKKIDEFFANSDNTALRKILFPLHNLVFREKLAQQFLEDMKTQCI